MDQPRELIFARAALAGDQNGGGGLRHLARQFQHVLGGRIARDPDGSFGHVSPPPRPRAAEERPGVLSSKLMRRAMRHSRSRS